MSVFNDLDNTLDGPSNSSKHPTLEKKTLAQGVSQSNKDPNQTY